MHSYYHTNAFWATAQPEYIGLMIKESYKQFVSYNPYMRFSEGL
uniref:Uncharacterized protein n=1 Tax=Arundo donax TaxID=35708 RepID=A0A0A9F6W2_ARUDO